MTVEAAAGGAAAVAGARLEPVRPEVLIGWHARYACNPSALAALPGVTHMFTLEGVRGGLGVQRLGRVLVVGDPLAPPAGWAALLRAFVRVADEAGFTPAFGPVGAECAAVLRDLGWRPVRLGSTPYVHLRDWPARGKGGARVREAVNRAGREGLTLREVRPDRLPREQGARWTAEVEALSGRWLRSRRAGVAFHWIFELRPLAFRDRKRYFEARQAGRLVGLVAASPVAGRGAWYLEDVLRDVDAPASTGTALVACALDALKAGGVPLATLGGVPLARERGLDALPVTWPERLAYRVRPLLSRAYSFDGLETFKRRFGPAHWENEYLVLPPAWWAWPRAALALTRLTLHPGRQDAVTAEVALHVARA